MKFYERVISDFGGYEKCKDILSQPNIDFIMNVHGLREHMLEYRRQHNIYEPGDFCFLRDKHYTELWLVTNILDDGRIELKTGKYGYPVPTRCWGLYYGRADGLIHASKEEIAAGHRIEIDQSGLEELSMYDIGPNVIVIDK